MSRVDSAEVSPDNVGGGDPWYLAATPLVTLPWLVRMRWATVGVELLLLLMTFALPQFDLPLDHIVWLIVADALANALSARWLTRRGAWPLLAATGGLAIQIVLLTALLELTGGPSNPFVVIYVLQIALAAVTLGRVAASGLGLVAALSFVVLLNRHVHELVPTHHRLNDFPTHLFTIWIAGTVTAELLAYFVGRASDALRRREDALAAMRQRAARSERLISLSTLAAGAAHELSTPLATIALASRELQHALEALESDEDLAEDARLIRSEVDRCQAILDQMSGRAGGATADEPELVAITEILDNVRARLPSDVGDRIVVHVAADFAPVFVPRAGLSQTLLALLTNALDASEGKEAAVVVEATTTSDVFRVSVADNGSGLSPEAARRAGEPFYTTKEPGRGMGLGLFLARVFAERLGGSLKLESDIGTRAVLELPIKTAWSQTT